MNVNLTALSLVVDRSGSMESIASDVRGSVRQFIRDQKTAEGKAFLTVSQFDDRYETVYDFKDIKEVDEEQFAKDYSPRGSTALLDAIGRATLTMQKQLDGMAEADRPKRVVVAVITDGLENASHEFDLNQIKEMIKAKEAAGWDFMFLGATLDTIDIAKNMGFSALKSAVYETSNFSTCMKTVNEQILKARLDQEIGISQEDRDNLTGSGVSSATV